MECSAILYQVCSLILSSRWLRALQSSRPASHVRFGGRIQTSHNNSYSSQLAINGFISRTACLQWRSETFVISARGQSRLPMPRIKSPERLFHRHGKRERQVWIKTSTTCNQSMHRWGGKRLTPFIAKQTRSLGNEIEDTPVKLDISMKAPTSQARN